MSCNLWGSFASVVPIVSQLGNTLSKFHRMYTVLQTVELCLIYFFKKCRQCNRRNLPCSFNHFSYREMALQILTLFRGLFFFFPPLFQIVSQNHFFLYILLVGASIPLGSLPVLGLWGCRTCILCFRRKCQVIFSKSDAVCSQHSTAGFPGTFSAPGCCVWCLRPLPICTMKTSISLWLSFIFF